ncbi:MAG: hypothetical protein ONA69_06355 [candidate division KSB1 bacterium]|nr:hypothetical protein [candidate division KSB1 bacterium]
MHLKGFNVPPFIVISTKSFLEFENEAVRRLFRQRLAKIFQSQGILFPQGKIAVRSSAPYEDTQDTSLAGQLETVLDVSDEKELIKAIITVKSSAASNKIKSYRRHVKGESRSTEIAVIIQQQIEPEISGVMFTSHPLSHQDLMVIEAVRGPCSNLVSGRTSPKQFIIDKSAHQIIDQIEGDYADLVVDPERLNELIQLGATVERLFHQPMDIEWGFARNRLWLFQARPITTLQQSKIRIDQKKREWTNFFFAERFDRPISPLAWSFLFPLISRRALADPLWYLGKEKLFKQSKLITQFEGVPYARLDAFRALYSIIPYRLLPADKRQFFSPQRHKQLYLICRALPALVSRLLIQDPQWIPWLNLRQWRRFSSVCEKKIKQLNEQLEQEDLENLCDILESTYRLSDHFLSIHRWSITFADLFAELLYHFLQKTLQSGNKVQDLLSGLPDNASVQAETALDALDVENKDEVQKFINCYGHRSQSLDFSLPTWGESIYAIKKNTDRCTS